MQFDGVFRKVFPAYGKASGHFCFWEAEVSFPPVGSNLLGFLASGVLPSPSPGVSNKAQMLNSFPALLHWLPQMAPWAARLTFPGDLLLLTPFPLDRFNHVLWRPKLFSQLSYNLFFERPFVPRQESEGFCSPSPQIFSAPLTSAISSLALRTSPIQCEAQL